MTTIIITVFDQLSAQGSSYVRGKPHMRSPNRLSYVSPTKATMWVTLT